MMRKIRPLVLILAACGATSDVEQRTQTTTTAAVWVSPTMLPYASVLSASAEHADDPSFSVFIELADGSACTIDPASVRLNGFPALPDPIKLGDADKNGIPDLRVRFDRGVFAGNV